MLKMKMITQRTQAAMKVESNPSNMGKGKNNNKGIGKNKDKGKSKKGKRR